MPTLVETDDATSNSTHEALPKSAGWIQKDLGSPSRRDQKLNELFFAICQWSAFLCAPVLYVDLVHASLCHQLGASALVMNLPITARMLLCVLAPVVTWLLPRARVLRMVVFWSYVVMMAATLLVVVTLLLPLDRRIRIAAIVIHGTLAGGAATTAWVYLCDILSRGVPSDRQPQVMRLTYSVGPGFAVVGSLFSQWLLGTQHQALNFPYDFALLFAVSIPVMAAAALISLRFRFPEIDTLGPRESLGQYLLGGFWEFLEQKQFLLLITSHLLLIGAFGALGNVSLLAKELIGREPKDLAGYMNVLRFLGKLLGGSVLGYVMVKRGPRMAVISGALLTCAAFATLLVFQANGYLLSFLIFGAAELATVYYFSYGMMASPEHLVKRNIAFMTLLVTPASFAPSLLGLVADLWNVSASLAVALFMGIGATILCLPLPRITQTERQEPIR